MSNETKWSIDPSHSEISFKVRHLMIAHVSGSFKNFDASIYVADKNFATAEIDLWIDAASITTGNETRDEHLKGTDFFDVVNHEQIGFTSSTIEKADENGNHTLWGELTIKGITKNVKLNVVFGGVMNDPWGNEKAGFSVTGTIDRNHWGLAWNTILETGAIMVSDEIQISCEIELTNTGTKDLSMHLDPVVEESIIF
jgi:polyisoprenoid-binding protein YceI